MTAPAFFFDRCFPLRIARMLGQYWLDHEVRARDHDQRFEKTDLDVAIIERLAADSLHRWALVSADRKIMTRPHERVALARSGLELFYLGRAWFKMPTHEQARKFVKAWPMVVDSGINRRERVFEIERANLKVPPAGH